MRKFALFATLVLLFLSARAVSRADFENAPLGIAVTRCDYSVHGVNVFFETDLPPPYVVAIFCPDEVGFISRLYPAEYKVVTDKLAFFPGDYITKGNMFVQVFGAPYVRPDWSVSFSNRVDVSGYFSNLHDNFNTNDVVADTFSRTWDVDGSDREMVIFDDHLWTTFQKSTNRYITVQPEATGFQRWNFETNEWQRAVTYVTGFYSNVLTGVATYYNTTVTTNEWYEPYVTQDVTTVNKTIGTYGHPSNFWFCSTRFQTLNDERWDVKKTKEKTYTEYVMITNSYTTARMYQNAEVTYYDFYSNRVTGASTPATNIVVTTNAYYTAYVTNDVTSVWETSRTYQNSSNHLWKGVRTRTLNDERMKTVVETRITKRYVGVLDSYDQKVTQRLEERSFGPFDTSVGTGYRIVYFEEDDDMVVRRAYSSMTNRSDEFVICRPLRALSAHNGMKVSLDWLGQARYVIETNAVPDRIYVEGL